MAYNITLSSSMRSNLLSLRNISTLMNKTQNILSTGKKVNSAIDNATSYYQARSLTNRASDLNSLLDSMSQGIQTIQAAVTGLENYVNYLEQAVIVAEHISETGKIEQPTKEWLMKNIGEDGALVSTLQELKDALADENIVNIYVYEDITMGSSDTINLTGNKRLQGINSDVTLTFSTSKTAITMSDNAELRNITINAKAGGVSGGNITGNVNISTTNSNSHGCVNTKVQDANLIVKATGSASYAIDNCIITDSKVSAWSDYGYTLNNTNIYRSTLNVLKTSEETAYNSMIRCNVYDSTLNIKTTGSSSYALSGTEVKNSIVNAYSTNSGGFTISISVIEDSIVKALSTNGSAIATSKLTSTEGSKIYYADRNAKNMTLYNGSETISTKEFVDEINNTFETAFDTETAYATEIYDKLRIDNHEYIKMLDMLDDMVDDSSYQGVNLLKGDELNVVFNEDRSHSYIVKGIDMRTYSVGIITRKWYNKDDIKTAINEVKETINKVRSAMSELGNNLSIIQTRQGFTDALTDILEVGADKLVLADMNETSAEYLMLQTRQQLAINSLSLASQSAKAVLSLF